VDLLTPEQYVGSIDIRSNQDGALVNIDDKPVGNTPLGTVEGLSVGKHLVVVSMGGVAPFASMVEVRYGEAVTVEATLAAGGTPITASDANTDGASVGGQPIGGDLFTDPLFLGGAAAVAVGGVAALAAGGGAVWAESYLWGEEGNYTEREAVKNTGLLLLATAGVATVVAVGGGAALAISLGD
jgi:hypothetical protein